MNLDDLLKIAGDDGLFFVQFFDKLPMGVMVIDTSGTVLYANKAQLEMDGITQEQIINRPLVETYGPASRGTSIMLYCLSTQQPVLNRWQIYSSPGRERIRAMCHTVPLFKNGRLAGCIGLTRHYPGSDTFADYSSASSESLLSSPEKLKFAHLIGRNRTFRQAIAVARAAAAAPMPVLIHGETGVGKELFARGIHNASPRSGQAFVAVNCAAIPESLFESLMFGVSQGAFTGAIKKAGFFEEAEGGTIFLDEVDSMPLPLQSKILRVIQEKVSRRLGSRVDQPVDVKIISAMGMDPLEAIEKGRLRSDLYFRLGALQISIPPLRDRLDDLELLVSYFISKHAVILGKKIQRPSQGLLDLFHGYSWPGNVRELEHTITGTMIMASSRRQTLGPDLLPEYFKNIIFGGRHNPDNLKIKPVSDTNSTFIEKSMDDYHVNSPQTDLAAAGKAHEKNLIKQKLSQSFGNVSLAARLLKLSPQTLTYKMKKHGLKRKDFLLDKVN